MANDKIKINVLVANMRFPISIDPKDEEIVRKAAKLVNERLQAYDRTYSLNKENKEKCLAMLLLDIAVKFCMLEDNEYTPFTEKVEDLNQLVERYLGH